MISGTKVVVKQRYVVLYFLYVQTHDGFTWIQENLYIDGTTTEEGYLSTAVYAGTSLWYVAGDRTRQRREDGYTGTF
jgi:hypothetical protein